MGKFIEKYFDLTAPGVKYDINKYISNGWYIYDLGVTLAILRKDI